MHKNPEAYFNSNKDFIENTKNDSQSKFKKYITRASLVISGILFIAMAIKLLPFVGIAMLAMHVTMYCTFGIGLLGLAEQKYSSYKKNARKKETCKALTSYRSEFFEAQRFFLNRKQHPTSDNENKHCPQEIKQTYEM